MSGVKDTVEGLIMVLAEKLLTPEEAKDAARRIFAIGEPTGNGPIKIEKN